MRTLLRCLIGATCVLSSAASGAGATAAPGPGSLGTAVATSSAVRTAQHPRSLTVSAVGDLLPENRVLEAAAAAAAGSGRRYDLAALLAPIRPLIEWADLAICHVETPIGWPGEATGQRFGRSAYGGYLLRGPWELAEGIAATGFDRCSTASNHSWDMGAAGVDSTLAALDAAGISHVGTARSPAEDQPVVFEVAGVRVAHLSATRFSNTGFLFPGWRVDTAVQLSNVVRDVEEVRSAGAEIVILSMHLGIELRSLPRAEERAMMDELTRAVAIDLVIEHGPHVVQPVESVNGALVFWSVGNLISGMGTPDRGKYGDPRILDGLVAAVRFTETAPGRFRAEAVPVTICTDPDTKHVRAPSLSLDDPALSDVGRRHLADCLARTQAIVPAAV